MGKAGQLTSLFITFMKIGAFTFGGGYAMIPLIQREVVENRQWISDQDILDIVAIAESTPGPIAINAATFIGYKTGGFAGALVATIGVILPSFFMIYAISFVLNQFQNNQMVKYAFTGIRAGVLALIVKALYAMYRKSKKSLFCYLVAGAAFFAATFLNLDVIVIIAGCAIAGLLMTVIASRRIGER